MTWQSLQQAFGAYLLLVWLTVTVNSTSSSIVDPDTTLECHRREYRFRAQKYDSLGRRCWDNVNAMVCWGRCDSLEIADWKFPYKVSHHPVCIHTQRSLRQVKLKKCDEGVEPGTEVYEYYVADSCACRVCRSTDFFCEGLLHISRARQRR